ncbi:MAG: type II toxin-antitoxin system RelE/ParE family toxin [Chitinophagales bacterium]|nr:type II toxin-antitoxin system RelE/ParE family toxin [Chitinophagales bacterium]
MKFDIYYTPEFEKQLKRLKKKYLSLPKDIKRLTEQLQDNPVMGTSLGNNCYKIRLAISSKGRGKSGGARIITCVIIAENEIYLADIYDKSEQENISEELLVVSSLPQGDLARRIVGGLSTSRHYKSLAFTLQSN